MNLLNSFTYLEPPTIPPGMTLAEWRRANPTTRRRLWRRRRTH